YTVGINHEDKEFVGRCFSRAKSVLYTGLYFILYRQHSESMSRSPERRSIKSIEDYRTVIKNLSNLHRQSSDLGEQTVLEKLIAESFAVIFRRIQDLKKKNVNVNHYTWKLINQDEAFELL